MVFKEKAYSIIEVMIGLSIMGIVGSSVVTLVGNKMNEHRLNSLQIAKDRIVRQLEEGLTNCENIQDSYTYYLNGPNGLRNRFIQTCMNASGYNPSTPGGQYTVCPPQFIGPQTFQNNRFDLWARPVPTVGGPPPISMQLSGYWNKDGEPNCQPDQTRCPFFVETYFYFSCPIDRSAPNGALVTQCNTPSRLNLLFTIKQTDQITAMDRGFNFNYPLPNGVITNPSSRALSVSVDKCRNTPAQICPPEMFVSGYDQSGAVMCSCYSNNPKRNPPNTGNIVYQKNSDGTDRNIPEECLPNKCNNGEIIVGYKEVNGFWEPECKTRNANRACRPGKSCMPGEYLAMANIRDCRMTVVPAQKKGGGPSFQPVCNDNQFQCCRADYF